MSPTRSATAASEWELAFALGGALVVFRAIAAISSGLVQLCGAAIAWRQVAPVLAPAPAHVIDDERGVARAAGALPARSTSVVVEARDVAVTNPGRREPVLSGLDLEIRSGERILLEGASGAGKSTLAHLLAGLRRPDQGLITVSGLDRRTLGAAGWSRRVTVAPQFHDSHVLGGTFAFNLLFGRRWPPEPGDLEEAQSVCRDLGLGPLLDQMPAGMLQIVGETGWQLSHGERSRLFAARAILSDADLVVLDESVAALDAPTAEVVLRSVRERARALMLIAHP